MLPGFKSSREFEYYMILPLSTIQSFQHLCLLLPGFKSVKEFVYSMIMPLSTIQSFQHLCLLLPGFRSVKEFVYYMIMPLSTIQSFQHLCSLLPGFKSLLEFVYSMILPPLTFWSKRNISQSVSGDWRALCFPLSTNFPEVFVLRQIFRRNESRRSRDGFDRFDWCFEISSLIVFNKDRISILLHSAWITIDYVGASCRRRVENIQRKVEMQARRGNLLLLLFLKISITQ